MTKTRFSLVAGLLCAVLASSCSEGVSRLSPSGPSNITAVSATKAGGDTIVRPSNAGDEATAEWATQHGWSTAADGLVVEGTDVITAVTGVCPSPTITVRGVPVAITATTTFTAPAACAALTVGTSVKVTGLLTFTATGFSVTATNIAIPSGSPVAPGSVKVEGTVASVAGLCPALTITLEGAGGVVVTSLATVFDPSTLCSSIAPGAKIEAVGSRNATGQLVATKVELDEDDDDNTGGGGAKKKVGGEGVVGAITGACPTLTLVITGNRVQVTAATQFSGGTCASLREGTQVKVDAEVQPDGSILAEKIEIQRIPGKPVSGDGKVDTVDGLCPTLTISVKGVTVTTSAATVFTGGTCASITPGTHIDVTGAYDGVSVTATAVAIRATGKK